MPNSSSISRATRRQVHNGVGWAVEQQLFEVCQLCRAQLRLAPGAAGMPQRLEAPLRGLLRPAADALLRHAEAAGDRGLAEALVEEAQGSPAAPFESFEIAFDSSRISHTYSDVRHRKSLLYIMRKSIVFDSDCWLYRSVVRGMTSGQSYDESHLPRSAR